MKKRRSPLLSALTFTAVAACAVLPISTSFAQYDFNVVMNGLNNPRGLAFGPNGALYVTEAGTGGTGSAITAGGSGGTESYGTTGAISRLLGGVQSQVLIGAPSLAATGGNGNEASGLQDIVFVGNQAYGIIGLGANPTLRSVPNFTQSELDSGAQSFGHLVSLSLDGSNTITRIADVSNFEAVNNPGNGTFGDTVDSNPFSLIALPGGGFAVADAGANGILGVSAGGTVTGLSYIAPSPNPLPFGPPFYQSVPTGIALGTDGAYYFTQLTGFPFPPGGANIYKFDPTNNQTSIAYSGFTNLLDLAFAPDGSLYALQNSTNGLASQLGPGPGVLVKIDTNGNRTIIDGTNLVSPTALAIGADGSIYVSNQGSSAGTGQVVRISASAPEPGSLPLLAAGGLLSLVGLGRNGLRRRRSVK